MGVSIMMFSEKFSLSESFEIEHKGKTVRAFYNFDKKGEYILRFKFISTLSQYDQAIVLHLDSFVGKLYIDEKRLEIPKNKFPQIVLEEKNAPRQFDLKVQLEAGELTICNGSDLLGTGAMWCSLDEGCAMIVDTVNENHMVFYCNDHENDDDFDDLIFEIEVIQEVEDEFKKEI